MTKKFTEEEYQKIVEVADKYFEQHKELAVTVNLKNIYDYISYNETVESKKIKDLNQELVLIALPKSRALAHDQFVEKEKKYRWRGKKKDNNGIPVYITIDGYGVVTLKSIVMPNFYHFAVFTESEIRKWGYDPDMFEREEVE
ncbi:hypothetical protein ACT5YR_07215 [Fructobacillus fructosus]|uniref:hypothetical protein n=1 Tax=Fructobacillus fructosus TaxID=1631 RepID=UPI0040341BCB